MSVERQLLMAASGVSTQYTIAKSLRFRSSASAYLSRTPASAGNQTTWTWSGWIKKGNLTVFEHLFGASSSVNNRFSFNFDNSVATGTNGDYLCAFIVLGGTVTNLFQTNALFRDPSSWYHIVLAVDTTQATATNRLKLYVNGVQQTFSTYNAPAQNTAMLVNSAIAHNIASGAYSAGTFCFDGYMAEINFIDGQALTPSSFGETSSTTGVWIPKQYSGSYGTNGFYLKLTDTTSTTALGYDSSGNGNNWTPNNLSLTTGSTYDSMLDSPTNYDNGGNGVGNYAVLNPLYTNTAFGTGTYSSGNLEFSVVNGGSITSNFSAKSGKWYFEISCTSNAVGVSVGIRQVNTTDRYSNSIYYDSAGTKTVNGTTTSYGTSYTNNDIIGIAVDAEGGSVVFYKNNTSQGSILLSAASITDFVAAIGSGGGFSAAGYINFGQRPFAYTPPTGYKALNTQNLSAPSIVNGASYMAATTYTGNGSTQTISGAAFQPDFIWIKSRSAGYDHRLQNSVVGMQGLLSSNSTAAEYTASSGDYPTATSSGFTLPYGANGLYYNGSGVTFVAWQWKAGGTAVTNTAGSITSSVSANTTAGFSVVTYTGTGANATVGHGLGVAPSFVIVKVRSTTNDWTVYHQSIGNTGAVFLDLTNAIFTNSAFWNNTSPTATTVSIGIAGGVNGSGSTYVAYCFAAIPGYSAFGSYTGNGSADGPFVYTGMRPRYVMIKRTDAAYSWFEYDTSRDTYNVTSAYLIANGSQAEQSYGGLDILSNGFKMRGTVPDLNASGGTYIYAAFAENPLQNARAR